MLANLKFEISNPRSANMTFKLGIARRQAARQYRLDRPCPLCTQSKQEHTSSWHSDYSLAKEHESSRDQSQAIRYNHRQLFTAGIVINPLNPLRYPSQGRSIRPCVLRREEG